MYYVGLGKTGGTNAIKEGHCCLSVVGFLSRMCLEGVVVLYILRELAAVCGYGTDILYPDADALRPGSIVVNQIDLLSFQNRQ